MSLGWKIVQTKESFLSVFYDERERWCLWLPVFLGGGVAFYFSLPVEPPVWLGLLLVLSLCILLYMTRRRPGMTVLLPGGVAMALGFAAAQGWAWNAAAPVVERQVTWSLSGTVEHAEETPRGQRVIISDLSVQGQESLPRRVRVLLTARSEKVEPGQRVSVRAVLMPPPLPAQPGAYDFSRDAWFRGIGGVGYAVSRVQILPQPDATGLAAQAGHKLARLRHTITGRIREGVGGEEGTIATALMTGQRAAIPSHLLEAYRNSGLAHLLAISGLHMSLVAGLVFVGVRGVLALVPSVALRHPIKKWAAAVALPVTFFYLLIAGAPVPTQRAFLMTGIVLLAVMVDRNPISMRLVAWAAALVLLWQPHSLTGPSFQMSFAAVIALVALYEILAPRMASWRGLSESVAGRMGLYLFGVMTATAVAGFATAAFGLFHFHSAALWSIPANLVAVPIMAFWTMPWAVLSFLLMPPGLEAWALIPMGWGIAWVNQVALTVSSWPGATLQLPAMPVWGLAVFALGGAWLCLWRQRWRLLGLPLMLLGLLSPGMNERPDLLVDGEAEVLAVRGGDGLLVMSEKRKAEFIRDIWRRRDGGLSGQDWPTQGSGAGGVLSCDSLGCLYTAQGKVIALVRNEGALSEDCAAADAVIALVPVRRRCAPVTIDRFDLWREGGHAVFVTPNGIRVESVAAYQGKRLWSRQRGRQ
nr:ComEC/Rec2 family competence protein [Telmatospirillum sp. J64-1]